jgi:hypothetical protein
MDADGSGERAVSRGSLAASASDGSPQWSTNRKLAFSRFDGREHHALAAAAGVVSRRRRFVAVVHALRPPMRGTRIWIVSLPRLRVTRVPMHASARGTHISPARAHVSPS